MYFYDVEVDCMAHCYGGSPKFTVEPYGYGGWAKREDVDVLIAERDRLAAENAELRKERDAETVYLDLSNKQLVIDYEQALKDLTAANAALDEERAAYSVLLESHEIILDALTESDATLDALRERLPEYDTSPEDWEFGDLMRCVADFHNILYPQPAAMAEENDNG